MESRNNTTREGGWGGGGAGVGVGVGLGDGERRDVGGLLHHYAWCVFVY